MNNFASDSRIILNKVGQFMSARKTAVDSDELEPIIDELKSLYDAALPPFEAHLREDPSLGAVIGVAAHALATYYVEYSFVPEKAEQYAASGRTHMKAYLDRCQGTMDKSMLNWVYASYCECCEYSAYLALVDDRYDEVIPLMQNSAVTKTSLGMTGVTLSINANEEDNPEKMRAALSILEQMDKAIEAPAEGDFQEDVYRYAYTYYALMLANNADRFPDAGFKKDLPRAISVLRRGINLIHDEQYIAWLQEYIDKYTQRMMDGEG